MTTPNRTSPDGHLFNTSVDYNDNHVDEDLHPAFEMSGTTYSPDSDRFLSREDAVMDNDEALKTSRDVFSDALKMYEREADPKFKTGINLQAVHTWNEVMIQVEVARNKYKGMGGKSIVRSIHSGLRNFFTAASAIEAWLKLLPSTSIYGSVVCGGITMILEVQLNSCCKPSQVVDWI